MSLISRKKDRDPCKLCQLLRRSVSLIAISAVLPIVGFMCLIVAMDTREMNPAYRDMRDVILESVAGLLHMQLFIATAILIASVLRKRRLAHYRMWYFVSHISIMTLSFILTTVLTFINDSYVLLCLIVSISATYLYVAYKFLILLRHKMAD